MVVEKFVFAVGEWAAFFAPVAPAVFTFDVLWVLALGEVSQDLPKFLLLHTLLKMKLWGVR